jgi:hypothetical protein
MPNPPTVSTLATAVACAALLGAGCGQKKVNECNALVQVINAGVQSLEKSPKADGDANSTADLKAMAEAMDKVAADAARVELTLPELKKFSTDYQAMVKEVSKAARDMAAATDSKDKDAVGKVAAATAAMEKAVKQEDPLVDGINKFCQAP